MISKDMSEDMKKEFNFKAKLAMLAVYETVSFEKIKPDKKHSPVACQVQI